MEATSNIWEFGHWLCVETAVVYARLMTSIDGVGDVREWEQRHEIYNFQIFIKTNRTIGRSFFSLYNLSTMSLYNL